MQAHDIAATVGTPPEFETADPDGSYARFWNPVGFNEGTYWIGQWKGTSPWERHPVTEELLCAHTGEYQVTILKDEGQETLTVRPGAMVVVPRNHWHRIHSDDDVTAFGITPGPTDHSMAADPRAESE